MRRAALLGLALAALAAPSAAQESCITCHGEEGVVEARGVHATAGVQCIACHGGVAGTVDLAGAHGTALRVARTPRARVELCGGCHADAERMRGFGQRSDQLLLYATSGHGRRLAEADDPDVATCVSCHGAHGVLAHTDPRSPVHPARQPETCGSCHDREELMQRYGLRADVGAQFRASVHGQALLERGATNSPACATCHGSHGATPPGVEELGRVCGRCHTPARAQFERSPHLAPAREGVIEECVSCHGSHAVAEATPELLVGAQAGHCGSCHARDAAVVATGSALHGHLTGFARELAAAEAALSEAARGGLFVEHERDLLARAQDVLGQAVPAVHALSEPALDAHLEPGRGMVQETLEGLAHKRHELGDRKVLVLVFVGALGLLVGVLLVHAREVAGRATGSTGPVASGSPAGAGRDGDG